MNNNSINKVLYNVDQTIGTNCTTADERKLARKNIGLNEVVGQAATETEAGIAPLDENGKVPESYINIQVPTKTSDLQNDSGFITDADIPAIPTKTSELQNDSGFVTSSAIPTVGNGTITIKRNSSTVGSFTTNQSGHTSIDISVPTKTSDIRNDSGFITSADLPSVGNGTITLQKNGSAVDSFTTNQSGNKTINLTVPTKTSEITNDSGFITSSDLPSVGNGTITIQKNGTNVDSFTANQSSNKNINIPVPTKTSDITNDSGFITSADLPTQQQSNWMQTNSAAVDFIKNKRAFKTFVTSYDYPDCLDTRNIGANTKTLVYFPYEDRKKVLFVNGRVYDLKITSSGILPQDSTIEAITARLFTLDTDGNRKYLCPAYTFKAGNSVQFDLHWEASDVFSISEAYLDECAPHIEFDCFLKANTDFTIYCNGLEWHLNENVAV